MLFLRESLLNYLKKCFILPLFCVLCGFGVISTSQATDPLSEFDLSIYVDNIFNLHSDEYDYVPFEQAEDQRGAAAQKVGDGSLFPDLTGSDANVNLLGITVTTTCCGDNGSTEQSDSGSNGRKIKLSNSQDELSSKYQKTSQQNDDSYYFDDLINKTDQEQDSEPGQCVFPYKLVSPAVIPNTVTYSAINAGNNISNPTPIDAMSLLYPADASPPCAGFVRESHTSGPSTSFAHAGKPQQQNGWVTDTANANDTAVYESNLTYFGQRDGKGKQYNNRQVSSSEYKMKSSRNGGRATFPGGFTYKHNNPRKYSGEFKRTQGDASYTVSTMVDSSSRVIEVINLDPPQHTITTTNSTAHIGEQLPFVITLPKYNIRIDTHIGEQSPSVISQPKYNIIGDTNNAGRLTGATAQVVSKNSMAPLMSFPLTTAGAVIKGTPTLFYPKSSNT